MSAAIQAKELGLTPVVVDEQAAAGGRLLRPTAVRRCKGKGGHRDWVRRKGLRLLERFEKEEIDVIEEATVWALFDQRTVAMSHGGRSELMQCDQLIMAPGAYERVIPFAGWTLPGVYTAGALQGLVEEHDIVPGDRLVLAGSGPFLFGVARRLGEAGGTVVAVLESATLRPRWENLLGLAGGWRFVVQGLRDMAYLLSIGVRLRKGCRVVRAEGKTHLESVSFAESAAGPSATRPSGEQSISVDAIGVGFGFIPSVELAALAGCRLAYDRLRGGWIPVRGPRLETSVPGVFSVGDGAGIRGAAVAMEEGRIAAIWAAVNAGCLSETAAKARAATGMRRLHRFSRFAQAVSELYAVRADLYSRIEDEVIVCRCEDVTAGEIRSALRQALRSMDSIKGRTRAGMGECQGRVCGPVIMEMVGADAGMEVADVGTFRWRPPVKPVSAGDIADLA